MRTGVRFELTPVTDSTDVVDFVPTQHDQIY